MLGSTPRTVTVITQSTIRNVKVWEIYRLSCEELEVNNVHSVNTELEPGGGWLGLKTHCDSLYVRLVSGQKH